MLKNKIFKFIIVVAISLLAFNFGIWYGQKQIPFVGPIRIINQDIGKPKDLDFSLFWDTWSLIEQKYASKIDKTKMFYGAISGMVKSLDDPYTVFMDPSETNDFSQELKGTFEGIGAEIGVRKSIITIIAPLSSSPAEKAGLKPLDKVIKINDTSTMDLSLEEAVNLIRGPKGTAVTLTILRGNESETREISIIRNTIVVKSVELKIEGEKENKIAVLKISRFGEDTFDNVNIAADEILKQDAKGMIIDLRNNPGGFLDSAVDIAGIFMPKGEIVTIQSFSNNKKENYLADGSNKLGNIPTVILANEGSASAAEILAGALKDNRKIQIIGEKTYGKGSVQEVQNLKDGSSVKITIAEWLTPSGKNINKEGIAPDIEIKLTKEAIDENKDPQMDKALEIIKTIEKK